MPPYNLFFIFISSNIFNKLHTRVPFFSKYQHDCKCEVDLTNSSTNKKFILSDLHNSSSFCCISTTKTVANKATAELWATRQCFVIESISRLNETSNLWLVTHSCSDSLTLTLTNPNPNPNLLLAILIFYLKFIFLSLSFFLSKIISNISIQQFVLKHQNTNNVFVTFLHVLH